MLQIETQTMVGTVLLRVIVVDFRGWKSHITHVSIFWWCQTNGIWAFTQCALNMYFFHIFGGVLFILSLCMGGVLIDHVFSGYTVATSTQPSIIYPFIGVCSAKICCFEGCLKIVFWRWRRRWSLCTLNGSSLEWQRGPQKYLRNRPPGVGDAVLMSCLCRRSPRISDGVKLPGSAQTWIF
jgi:hypothetical protein